MIESSPIRWGILGAGAIAAKVGADIAATGRNTVHAVGARDRGRAEQFAAARGIPRAYGSYDDLVADPDVDVVYIATPHSHHHAHALLALQAGKPVLVEKAFAINAREAREIVACARERRLFCMEAMWMRFNPLVRRAQELVAAGAIGDVVSLRADLCSRFDYDPAHRLFNLDLGGGALLDIGVYAITFARLFLGAPEVTDVQGTFSPTGSDASVIMQSSYPGGALSQIMISAVAHSPAAATICGTTGAIELGPRIHRATELAVTTPAGVEQVTVPLVGNGFGPEIAEVERCLRAGELESPVVPLDETVAILEFIDAMRARLGVHYAADRG